MDPREALGWSGTDHGRVTETPAMTVDLVKRAIMAVREATGVLLTMALCGRARSQPVQVRGRAERDPGHAHDHGHSSDRVNVEAA